MVTSTIVQQAVFNTVDPTMDRKRLASLSGFLNNRGVTNVKCTFDHIQLTEPIQTHRVVKRSKHFSVLLTHVTNVTHQLSISLSHGMQD
jgi:hypothetical protein